MSHLTRYPVPQGTASGAVNAPRLHFRLEPTIVPHSVFASEFDGTNDWLSRSSNLSGIADSKVGLISLWYLSNDDGAPAQTIFEGRFTTGIVIRLQKTTSDIIDLLIFDPTGVTTLLSLDSSAETVKVVDGWNHILLSWDLNAATSRAELYINNVDVSNIITGPIDTAADYTSLTDWGVGAGGIGNNKTNGCLAQVYFNSKETLDLSVTANRRLFISANLKPVDLGSDGSNSTGNTPIIYLDKTAADFHLNAGTGGDFTQNGALTACSPPHVTDALQPFRGLEAIEAGAVDDPQLFFRLEPTIVPDPVLDFLQPFRGLEAIEAGAVDDPQLFFRLELPITPPVLKFLRPLRGLEAIEAGAVDDPQLFFRLEPTIAPDPVLEFLQPQQAAKQGILAGAVDNPQLFFRLEPGPAPVLEFLRPKRGLEVVEAGAVDDPRLFFRLEPTIVPAPVLEFLQPLQATPQGIPAGAVDDPQLFFRLEPTIVPDPVLDFLQPSRGLEAIEAGAVDDPRLYFRLEPVTPPALEFLLPRRGLEATPAGAVDDPQLFFRLEPTIVGAPVLEFLQPHRGLEAIKAGKVAAPKLHFRILPEGAGFILPWIRRRRR